MDDTTDTMTRPGTGFPPPAFDSAPPPPPPWPGQISQAPSLPTVTAAVPRPPSAPEANPFATAMFSSQPSTPQQTPQRQRSGLRRTISWLFLLAVIGGLAYGGIVYGPELVDKFTGPDETSEPPAPLVFPLPTATPSPVRSATFTVSEPDPFRGTQDYEVTADFESGVAQVVIPRSDTPDLEILSVWDQAFIRRIDDPTWYSLPRGDFPIDNSLGRIRWVRTLDELIPAGLRQMTTITDASESLVGTEPTRRLMLSVEAARLLQAQSAAEVVPADGSAAPAPALPPGMTVPPGLVGAEPLEIEIWVDDAGIVRKSVLPEELGGETIVVTSVSPDAWEATFPTPDLVLPLTAQALFHLGI
jgi:hypothetical protein